MMHLYEESVVHPVRLSQRKNRIGQDSSQILQVVLVGLGFPLKRRPFLIRFVVFLVKEELHK